MEDFHQGSISPLRDECYDVYADEESLYKYVKEEDDHDDDEQEEAYSWMGGSTDDGEEAEGVDDTYWKTFTMKKT